MLTEITTTAFIIWLIFQPQFPKFHVDDVTLTKFTHLSTNNTLYYNMAVSMTLRNPNKWLGIYYDKIELNGMYQGVRFASNDLTPFYLGHKTEKNVGTVFKGQQVMVFGNGHKEKYDGERKDNVYNIDLKLRLKIRFKVFGIKLPKFTRKFNRSLKVPLSRN
ncbi:NDR1/HIN1-like protein 3 [Tanacetum coccineum]